MYVKTKYLKEFLFFQMFNIRLDSFFLTSKKLVTDRRFGGRHRFFLKNETVKGTVKDCL